MGKKIREKRAVATWNVGIRLSICLQTDENQEIQPVSRWPAGRSQDLPVRNDFYPAVRIATDENTTTCLSLYG
jgi:hypothetical protein